MKYPQFSHCKFAGGLGVLALLSFLALHQSTAQAIPLLEDDMPMGGGGMGAMKNAKKMAPSKSGGAMKGHDHGTMGGMGGDGMGAGMGAAGMEGTGSGSMSGGGKSSGGKGCCGMDAMGMMGRSGGGAAGLPGFPGLPHVYHLGASGFFLDRAALGLTAEQRTGLSSLREKAALDQATAQRKIDQAEQELWVFTGADRPNAASIEAKLREIERLQTDQRLSFIRSVGEAATRLTDAQRMALLSPLAPVGAPVPAPAAAPGGMGGMGGM